MGEVDILDLVARLALKIAKTGEHADDLHRMVISLIEAKDAEIARLKEHQKLHDRIFERQKLLLSHYAGTIKEAAKRLRYSTLSIEQPEPYNSRTPIVAAFLEQALGANAEELEKERDALTHANARLREALDKLARLGNEPHYGNSTGNVIAQHALADTEGQEGIKHE